MRKLIKVWPLILIVILLFNTPAIKGLTNVQLDRSISFQLIPGGELTVIGIGGGVPGALELPHQAENFGKLINNYGFDIELDIVVEVEFLEAVFEGTKAWWDNILISVGPNSLDFQRLFFGDSYKRLATGRFLLEPGGELDIKMNRRSDVIVIGKPPRILHYALGVARFYITGYNPQGEVIFYLEPSEDLLQQYFFKGSQVVANATYHSMQINEAEAVTEELESAVFIDSLPEYLDPIRVLHVENLNGFVESLQHDPEDPEAINDWYEAVDSTEDTVLYLLFDDPGVTLVGSQTIAILARKTDNSLNVPKLDLDLFQNGEYIITLVAEEEINSNEGAIYLYDFDPEILRDSSAVNLGIWLHGYHTGGAAEQRNTVEFGAIRWLLRNE